MGIKNNFLKFLKTRAPGAFVEMKHLAAQGRSCAIDVPIYMNKYRAIFGQYEWRPRFEAFLDFFVTNEISAWCVFDGSAPKEKRFELETRRNNRMKTDQLIKEIETSLANFGQTGTLDPILESIPQKRIPVFFLTDHNRIVQVYEYLAKIKKHVYKFTVDDYDWVAAQVGRRNLIAVTARGEAEKLCAGLCQSGKVDYVLSDDSDLIAYLCPRICTKFNIIRDNYILIDTQIILTALNMTREQFVDFCIMCGTDFNRNCPGIGPVRAFEMIQKYKSIEEFAAATETDITPLNHLVTRKIFGK